MRMAASPTGLSLEDMRHSIVGSMRSPVSVLYLYVSFC